MATNVTPVVLITVHFHIAHSVYDTLNRKMQLVYHPQIRRSEVMTCLVSYSGYRLGLC
jgi:hypothetical protein